MWNCIFQLSTLEVNFLNLCFFYLFKYIPTFCEQTSMFTGKQDNNICNHFYSSNQAVNFVSYVSAKILWNEYKRHRWVNCWHSKVSVTQSHCLWRNCCRSRVSVLSVASRHSHNASLLICIKLNAAWFCHKTNGCCCTCHWKLHNKCLLVVLLNCHCQQPWRGKSKKSLSSYFESISCGLCGS